MASTRWHCHFDLDYDDSIEKADVVRANDDALMPQRCDRFSGIGSSDTQQAQRDTSKNEADGSAQQTVVISSH